jgi:hypothetical protein
MMVSDSWTNWLWLTPTDSRDLALIVGDVRADVASALRQEFARVEQRTTRALGESEDAREMLAIAPERRLADCVVLGDSVLGDRAGSRHHAALLATARAALRDGGCLFVAGANAACRHRAEIGAADVGCAPLPRDLERQLLRAGFRDVRRFYALPTHNALHTLVPATRSATTAIEQWDHWRSARRRFARCTAARVGLHGWMYPSLAYLALA